MSIDLATELLEVAGNPSSILGMLASPAEQYIMGMLATPLISTPASP